MTRRRLAVVVAAIAAVVLATLGVIGGASAAWHAGGTASGTVSTGRTSVSAMGFAQLTQQFEASTQTASKPALVKLYNTGTLPLSGFTSTVAFPSGGSDLASAVTLTIWDAGQGATSCPASAPSGANEYTGTWGASAFAWPTPAAPVPAPQGTQPYQGYCVVSSMTNEAITAHANQSSYPAVSVVGVDAGWSSAPAAADAFTLAAISPTSVAPTQIGVSNGSGSGASTSTVVSVALPSGDDKSTSAPTSNLDPTTGVIISPYYVCVVFTVNGTNSAPTDWSFQIDTSVAPFNGAVLQQSMFAPSGAQTARITGFPSASSHVYTIGGMHQGSATSFGTVYNGSGNGPDGYSNYTWNTPITTGQSAAVHLCLNVNQAAPIAAAGAGTYTVGAPKIAGCTSTNPAADSTAMGTAIPASNGSDGKTLCVYLPITGSYPHFYVGYTASMDWGAVLAAASGLTGNQRNALKTATAQTWDAFGYELSSTGTRTVQEGGVSPTSTSGTVLTWSETGQTLPLAISDGETVVIRGTYAIPAP